MNKGILFGVGAYLIWGVMPIWLKQIKSVPPLEIFSHRIVWSFILLLSFIIFRSRLKEFLKILSNKKVVGLTFLAAILLAGNWLTYIYAIGSNQVIESSLGYFINPLVNVILGVLFFKETLRPWQWLPVGLASLGVAYLTLDFGRLPWIALALAFTFALYAVVKKISTLNSLNGLTLETGMMFLPAIFYLVGLNSQDIGWFTKHGIFQDLMLVAAGVITATPLLLFGAAAKRIPLTMLGLLQYIAPTCQFFLGIFLFREPFAFTRLIGFIIVWVALVVFWTEGIINQRKKLQEVITPL